MYLFIYLFLGIIYDIKDEAAIFITCSKEELDLTL